MATRSDDWRNSGIRNREKTHCKHGHELTPENTGWQMKRDRKEERRSRYCKECQKRLMRKKREKPGFLDQEAAKMRRWRAINPERNKQNWTENRRRKKEWLDSQKIACNRCGFDHVAALEFHHTNPAEKDFLLSVAVSHYSLDRIKVEVEKCEIVCANCHRIHHFEERQAKLNSQEEE